MDDNGGKITMAILGERLNNVIDLLARVEDSLNERLDKFEERVEKVEDNQHSQNYWNYGLTGLGGLAAIIAGALGLKTQ